MKELVVISGKGGTGKTSVVASFAALAEGAVLADADVDAADLHLVLSPTVRRREDFSGGSRARIVQDTCRGCGKCLELCRFEAIRRTGPAESPRFEVDRVACEGCGVCAYFCPADAIDFSPAVNGQWFISDTRHGPLVHAALGVAEENSGKLVTVVRRQAARIATENGLRWILTDGAPGLGCPVIASIGGADLTLVVTEPTLSGLHDLNRVADLTGHFGIATMVAVNKWDVNPTLAEQIESQARERSLPLAGRVRYDRAVTEAQIRGRSVVEHTDGGAAEDMRALWDRVAAELDPAGEAVPAPRTPSSTPKEKAQ